MKFGTLVERRWEEAMDKLGLPEGYVNFSWQLGGEYPHFHTKRGYAVAFNHSMASHPPHVCSIMFAAKTADAPEHRQDGLIRHEIGHCIDYIVPKTALNRWAAKRGVDLPSTAERRADMIAYLIWGKHIYYDKDLVQSTKQGIYPRPEHLGL